MLGELEANCKASNCLAPGEAGKFLYGTQTIVNLSSDPGGQKTISIKTQQLELPVAFCGPSD